MEIFDVVDGGGGGVIWDVVGVLCCGGVYYDFDDLCWYWFFLIMELGVYCGYELFSCNFFIWVF